MRRLGWDAGQLSQARVYAQMDPARKVGLMLRWRAMQIHMLRQQLQAQHPGLSTKQMAALVLRRLELSREQHR